MIYRLSNNIVNYLERTCGLKEDKEIYLFGTRLLISTLIGTMLIFLIGIMTDYFIEAVIYEISMSSSRRILGGYHSKTYLGCILIYSSLFILTLLMSNVFEYQIGFIILIEVLSLILVYMFCPVENVNKLLSLKKKQIFKKYSLLYISIYSLMIIILYMNKISYFNIFINTFIIIDLLIAGGKRDYEKCKD